MSGTLSQPGALPAFGNRRRKAKSFSWSYSKIKNFKTCPRRYHHVDVLKDWKEADSEQLKFGNQLHDMLAKAIGHDGTPRRAPQPLPPAYAEEYQPWVDKVAAARAKGAIVLTEMKFAITADFQPCEWFAPNAWFRAIADVLVLHTTPQGMIALAADWKTGKILDDPQQLALLALCLFAHYPNLVRVKTVYYWLKDDAESPHIFGPADKPAIWLRSKGDVEALQAAHEKNHFPPNPGRLCRAWCPVKSCEHNGDA